MAEIINEKASSSTEVPSTPGPKVVPSEMRRLADDMHEKVSVYLQGQIEGSIAEYKLLEEMNKVTNQRYIDMKKVAEGVSNKLSMLNDKFLDAADEALRPYLEQVDEIDENTRKLEEAVNTMDIYVTTLGIRYFQP
uniref:Biogenesis of lysosome-related organelles complex 1 subunit 2 n=1 Tax=Syphacia muris TaxID=451379 RepID=A0A0N5AKI4_9BILA